MRSTLEALNEQGIRRYYTKPNVVVCRVCFRIELVVWFWFGVVWVWGLEPLAVFLVVVVIGGVVVVVQSGELDQT